MEAFLRRSMRSCLCSLEQEDLTELVDAADDTTMKFATVPPYYRSYHHGDTAFIATMSLFSIKREKLAVVCVDQRWSSS